jgi:hypothetical protein
MQKEEDFSLNEVVINTNTINTCNHKMQLKLKREDTEKTARFKADFYSRGIFKLKNAPKKYLVRKLVT